MDSVTVGDGLGAGSGAPIWGMPVMIGLGSKLSAVGDGEAKDGDEVIDGVAIDVVES